jgi:phage tail tape-measure protein
MLPGLARGTRVVSTLLDHQFAVTDGGRDGDETVANGWVMIGRAARHFPSHLSAAPRRATAPSATCGVGGSMGRRPADRR